jgi:hypothetical protein
LEGTSDSPSCSSKSSITVGDGVETLSLRCQSREGRRESAGNLGSPLWIRRSRAPKCDSQPTHSEVLWNSDREVHRRECQRFVNARLGDERHSPKTPGSRTHLCLDSSRVTLHNRHFTLPQTDPPTNDRHRHLIRLDERRLTRVPDPILKVHVEPALLYDLVEEIFTVLLGRQKELFV